MIAKVVWPREHFPFAWNGIFVFWLALTTYSIFLIMMAVTTLRANRASETG
ncbi:hypothetical protein [Nocardia gamkensis]|uniref:hypothetical protein n=1 Tax=Nocardia gamkensis TaxID=352869 RepID=UPI0037C94535